MASKQQERRNELYRQRGYRNYYDYRKQMEAGKVAAIRPERIRRESTKTAQISFFRRLKNFSEDFTFDQLVEALVPKLGDESRAIEWSVGYAIRSVARYAPEELPEINAKRKAAGKPRITRREYLRAYLEAFVDGDEKYNKVRSRGGSEVLRSWFVDIQEYYSAEEYEDRYGNSNN